MHPRPTRPVQRLLLAIALALSACAEPVVRPAPPPGFPADLRYDLVPRWIQWSAPTAAIDWPPGNGCSAPPVNQVIQPGTLIDRFGTEGGTFFSPKGEPYAARAVPYICQRMDYRIYRVSKPLPVRACDAAPWFGQPGGAKQLETADPAYELVSKGILETVAYDPANGPGPHGQCPAP